MSEYCMIYGKPLLVMALSLLSVLSVRATDIPNSEILYRIRHVRVVEGLLTVTDSVIMVINNKYGNEEISVVYDKINKLKNFKAWVEDASGNKLGVLSKNKFVDRNLYQEYSLYADQRERACMTDYPLYPHRFLYTYTVVSNSFFDLTHWNPRSYKSRPLHRAELWIHQPVNYPVRTLCKGLSALSVDTVGQQVITRYVLKPITIADDASKNPAIVDRPSFVWVVPEQFYYGLSGSNKTWQAFGNWVEQLNNGLTTLPESERIQVECLLTGLKDTVEKVRVLYHYIQDHTRYVNVQLGIGGMKSYPAAYVSVNKFGDCKALSTYMKALLECAGIKSHFVLVFRDEYPEPFFSEFATSQFNHVFLAVPVGKDTLWLENTSTTGAMRYVDVSTQDRTVLLVDGHNSRLIRTPALNRNAVEGRRLLDVRCTSEGDATIRINHLGRGSEYEEMNALSKVVSAKSQFIYLDRYIPFKHYDMQHFGFKQVGRDDRSAVLEIVFRLPGFLQNAQERAYLPQIPVYKGSRYFYKPDNHTLCFPIPVSEEDTVNYRLPDGFSLETIPEPVSLTCPYGTYNASFTRNDGSLLGVKSFYVREGLYDPDAYKILYEFIQKVTESEKKSLILYTNPSDK